MRILVYLGIIVVSVFAGYKLAQWAMLNKQIAKNIKPIIDELKIQLKAVQEKIKGANLSEAEKVELEAQKKRTLDLLASFYGYTTEQLNEILNKTQTA